MELPCLASDSLADSFCSLTRIGQKFIRHITFVKLKKNSILKNAASSGPSETRKEKAMHVPSPPKVSVFKSLLFEVSVCAELKSNTLKSLPQQIGC